MWGVSRRGDCQWRGRTEPRGTATGHVGSPNCGVARATASDLRPGPRGAGRRPRTRHTACRWSHPVPSRRFDGGAVNQAWTTAITELPTAEGWRYPAAVVDPGSRRIVDGSMSEPLNAELVCNALRSGKLTLSGMRRPRSDDDVYESARQRGGERPDGKCPQDIERRADLAVSIRNKRAGKTGCGGLDRRPLPSPTHSFVDRVPHTGRL